MSRKNHLLNVPTPTCDLSALQGEWRVVAESRDRLPLPWLCLFADAALRPCTLTWLEPATIAGARRNELRKRAILNPVVSVQAALANLERARPFFEQLARDPANGVRHWRAALAALAELPLPHLTLDPAQVLRMTAPKIGTAAIASAFGSTPDSLDAKRRVARLDADASDDDNFDGLDGGFLEPAGFLRRERSPAEAERLRARIAQLDTHRLVEAPGGFDALPLASDDHPPDAFWKDEATLATGRRHVAITFGPSIFIGRRRYYPTSLANRSARPLRVRAHAGFFTSGADWRLATHDGAWFAEKRFAEEYRVPIGGWIAPGQTVTFEANSSGDDAIAWAYWCENDAGERFVAAAPLPPSLTGGRSTERGFATPDPLRACPEAIRRVLREHVASCRRMAREVSGVEIDLDRRGVAWIAHAADHCHEQRDDDNVGLFGAFLGEAIVAQGRGEWWVCDEVLCIREGNLLCFPFARAKNHLVEGGARYSVAEFFEPFAAGERKAAAHLAAPDDVPNHPPDREKAAALASLRVKHADRRHSLHELTLDRLVAPRPRWMRDSDPLAVAVDQQRLLLREGMVRWGAIVQANKLLFAPGDSDSPAQLIHSPDPVFDLRPDALVATAQRLYELKNTTQTDPVRKALAERVTDESGRFMGRHLPPQFAAQEILDSTIMVYRQHLPGGVLSARCVPILTHVDTPVVMIVPFEFWPIELIVMWKERRL